MWSGWNFESTAVYILKHWIHSIMDEVCLGVDFAATFELSSSDMADVFPVGQGAIRPA